MEKRFLLPALSLFLTNLVNAQLFGSYGYGGYGFSLLNIFNSISPEEIISVSLLIVLMFVISAALKRIGIFNDHQGRPQGPAIAITSLIISLAATYGIYNSGYIYQIENFFINLGVSAFWVLIIIASVFAILKLGIPIYLIIAGTLTIIVTLFTDVFFEKEIAFIIGILLFAIGLFLTNRSRRKRGMHVFHHGGNQNSRFFPWSSV